MLPSGEPWRNDGAGRTITIGQRTLCHVSVDDGQFGGQTREFIVMTQCHPHLVGRQRQGLEPPRPRLLKMLPVSLGTRLA